MTWKEANQLTRAWPQRYRIVGKILRGDDYKAALFKWELQIKKDFSDKWEYVYSNAPLGLGRSGLTIFNWPQWDIEGIEWI